jgi:ubiquitin
MFAMKLAGKLSGKLLHSRNRTQMIFNSNHQRKASTKEGKETKQKTESCYRKNDKFGYVYFDLLV